MRNRRSFDPGPRGLTAWLAPATLPPMKHFKSFLCLSAALVFTGCGTPFGAAVADFVDSPLGGTVTTQVGAEVIREAVARQPEIDPIVRDYRRVLEGDQEAVDFAAYEQRWVGVATSLMGSLTALYGEETRAHLIVKAIELALGPDPDPEPVVLAPPPPGQK